MPMRVLHSFAATLPGIGMKSSAGADLMRMAARAQ
jgi:hypothetical protein